MRLFLALGMILLVTVWAYPRKVIHRRCLVQASAAGCTTFQQLFDRRCALASDFGGVNLYMWVTADQAPVGWDCHPKAFHQIGPWEFRDNSDEVDRLESEMK